MIAFILGLIIGVAFTLGVLGVWLTVALAKIGDDAL